MKRLVSAAGFLAVLLAWQAGSAKTLEEVLTEKDVITEADYTNIHKQIAGKQATDDKQVRVQAQLAF